ncbi:MAG: hypothetical protein HY391_03150 [Deltaproteobacteria bacterium]|nr:hypothetical protein [Deltaproteobacteria bacterium]
MENCCNAIKIIPVSYRDKHFDTFLQLPWKIYAGDPNWVPPLFAQMKGLLNPKKNPFFRHSEAQLFLAMKGNEPAGRIAAIINRQHNTYYRDQTGFFGLFEAIDDTHVAAALFETTREWIQSRSMKVLRGPMNLSTNDECGLLIKGFEHKPYVMMTYNPPYYAQLLESCGFAKAKDLYAYYLDASAPLAAPLVQMAEAIRQKERAVIREINLKKFDEEVQRVRHIYNDAWSRNWGFVPMTEEEFAYKSAELKQIIEPSLAFVVEVDKAPVGFGLTIPNANDLLIHLNGRLFPFGFLKFFRKWKYIKSMRAITLGMVQEYQKKGLGVLCYVEMMQRAQKLGCARGEMSWILEDNEPVNKAVRQLGGTLYKEYRIYDRPLI